MPAIHQELEQHAVFAIRHDKVAVNAIRHLAQDVLTTEDFSES